MDDGFTGWADMEKGQSKMGIGIIDGMWGSEMLLYGGLGIMAVAVVAAIVCIVVFRCTWRKIRMQLEEKYGKVD